MASELTPERRAAIRARCEKATSGPWKAADGQLLCDSGWDVVLSCCNIDDSTLEFVANARTDVPDLLAALDASETEVAALSRELEVARECHVEQRARADASEAEVALTRGELDAAYEMASRLIAEKKALEGAARDAVDCLGRVLHDGRPFSLSQRDEVKLALESLGRALAGEREGG